ncbi:glycosyltransferase [Phycicoccus sp. M110.8]|uniref:glycosyltransferase family 2 protein n=1 Tax=Phycicoccus sp. M110.8 TaxID=3075433 RepID=UPI0028FD35FB|nr:glycosyltransferase [Phycicoccus sp. M110.8]MDU0314721.1 glycosyltransferase [Phycicoccus sp. M110.8]
MSSLASEDGPLLSVIVPVYNAETHLLECLESIAGQTFADFEVIVVDDGSTDGSRGIAEAFANEDERFTVINIPNGGVSRARNLGLDHAQGEYVTFVDADDWLADNTYSDLMQPTQHGTFDAVAGDLTVESSSGKHAVEQTTLPGGRYDAEKVRSLILPMLISTDVLTREWPFRIVTKVFRRAHLREHGILFSPGLRAAQDFVFSVAAMERTTSFYYAKGSAGYHYRWNPQSRTRSALTSAWENYRAVDHALRAAVNDRPEYAGQLVLAELHGDLSAMTYLYRACRLRDSKALYRVMRRNLSSVDRTPAYRLLRWEAVPIGKRVVCRLMRARQYRTLHCLLTARGLAQRLQQRRSVRRRSR